MDATLTKLIVCDTKCPDNQVGTWHDLNARCLYRIENVERSMLYVFVFSSADGMYLFKNYKQFAMGFFNVLAAQNVLVSDGRGVCMGICHYMMILDYTFQVCIPWFQQFFLLNYFTNTSGLLHFWVYMVDSPSILPSMSTRGMR